MEITQNMLFFIFTGVALTTLLVIVIFGSASKKNITKQFAIWFTRRILGSNCACYQMGYHNLVDFKQRNTTAIAKTRKNI